MRRRTVLGGLSACCGAFGLAGCTTLANGPPPRLRQLVFRSDARRPEALEWELRYAQHNNRPELRRGSLVVAPDGAPERIDIDHPAGFYTVMTSLPDREMETTVEFSSFGSHGFSNDIRMEFLVTADGAIETTLSER